MNSAAARPPLRPLDEALAELLGHARALGEFESVATFEADGRVLAQDLRSELQVPAHDNSSMDGYAVRSAEVGQAAAEGRALPVSQRIPAGTAALPLAPGTVARIFTGAPVPEGADAIVMQEDTETSGEQQVRFRRTPAAGQWIRRSGEDVRRGATVLHAGERLGPAALGLAASIGMDRLEVARRPRVALFSTGDELVMPGAVPPSAMPPGAIYNSNRFFLRALLLRLGCTVTDFGIVPDRRDATVEALRSAADGHDLILTSGGVSVGEEDHLRPAVQQLGSIALWQIAMKPGKPFAYGSIGSAPARCHVIGLPGNPVSSFVTFVLLVRPVLLALQGARGEPARTMLPAHFDWPRPDRRREFLRVRRDGEGGLALFPNQSSGVLTSAVWADGLVDVPAGQTIQRGQLVPFLSFAELLA
ncbi:gephyrin-like molybdotransferase Glp [Ramlibacter sp. AN1015]|uniref:molybdopterin molybdotransferase MoeA n=1 Tax=Ramlibacter sp. AN1015 TaxID=3133428 RepID=UPI0030C23341